MKDVIDNIGQFFILGFPGEKIPKAVSHFIREERIGGIILFADNCATHRQTKKLITEIKGLYESTNPFIAVDQEGGRVSRVKGAPAEIASAHEYGTTIGLHRFIENYQRSMLYLESLGFSINLAPVCDLFINANNDCLKDRCFGKTVEEVIPFITSAVNISRECGLLSCLKHFPGLGSSSIDPHKKTAVAYYDRMEWQQREKEIFATGAAAGADLLMTTHLLLPKIDKTIVTGSKNIVEQMAREAVGFNGSLITDDLTMEGASALGDIGERAKTAFKAGHDLLLFGQKYEQAMEAYEAFRQACLHGEISKEQVNSALERISGLKFKLSRTLIM